MSACSFERLLQFVNKQLNLDGQMEAYDHLDRCDICRDAVYQLSRDRDEVFFNLSRASRETIRFPAPSGRGRRISECSR